MKKIKAQKIIYSRYYTIRSNAPHLQTLIGLIQIKINKQHWLSSIKNYLR
jgi:hypothetical protein